MNTVKSRDMVFSVALYIGGAMLLTSYVTDILSWEAWIPALLALLGSFVVFGIYIKISAYCPGMHFLQINRSVLGKHLGNVVSWLYVFFFLICACFNVFSVSSFFAGYVMPDTPLVIFTLLFVFICSRFVRLGIENIIKLGIFFFVLISLSIVFNFVLLLSEMKLKNFLPLFDHGLFDYFRAFHTELMNPFGETIVFLMFADKLNNNGLKKSLLSGLLTGGIMLLVVMLRSIAVLGVTVSISNVPSYEVLRLININNMLTRIETLYSFLLLILGFFKVSVIYCAICRAAAYLTGIKSEKNITNSVGALIACFTTISFSSGFDGLKWGLKYSPFFSTPYVLLIPCILLLTSVIKRKKEIS